MFVYVKLFPHKVCKALAKACWVYKGEGSRCRSRNVFLGIVFICSMEYVVCVCAASLVGKVVSKRRNGDMIELRKQHVLWDVRGIVFAVVWRKPCLLLEEINFRVTASFVCLVDFGKRRALSPLKWPRGEMRARC